MRWRGVMVMSREGHTASQYPHSMQLSIREAAGGEGFRNIMCALGSCKGSWQQGYRYA